MISKLAWDLLLSHSTLRLSPSLLWKWENWKRAPAEGSTGPDGQSETSYVKLSFHITARKINRLLESERKLREDMLTHTLARRQAFTEHPTCNAGADGCYPPMAVTLSDRDWPYKMYTCTLEYRWFEVPILPEPYTRWTFVLFCVVYTLLFLLYLWIVTWEPGTNQALHL